MFKKLLVIGSIAGLLGACASQESNIKPDANPRPEWVRKGQGAFPGETDKIFAMGTASGIRNEAMLQRTADNRARVGLAEVLKTYVASMSKDYMSSASSNPGTGEQQISEEQYVEIVNKAVTEQVLRGTMIVDRWVSDDGTMYSLAVLDMNQFAKEAEKLATLDDRVKNHIKANATKGLEELDAELEKRRGE